MSAIKTLVTDLASDLSPVVLAIESGVSTTKDNYGDYLAVLSNFPGGYRNVVAAALLKAGASRAGVLAAVRLR